MNYVLQYGFEKNDSNPSTYRFWLYIMDDDEDNFVAKHSINYRVEDNKFIKDFDDSSIDAKIINLIIKLIGESLEKLEEEASKQLSEHDVVDHIWWCNDLDVLATLKQLDVYFD